MLACSIASSTTGWTSLAVFGVPLLGILLARFIVLKRFLNRPSGQVDRRDAHPSGSRSAEFPLATHPEPRADIGEGAAPQVPASTNDLVGV